MPAAAQRRPQGPRRAASRRRRRPAANEVAATSATGDIHPRELEPGVGRDGADDGGRRTHQQRRRRQPAQRVARGADGGPSRQTLPKRVLRDTAVAPLYGGQMSQ